MNIRNRCSPEYLNGVEEFLEFSEKNNPNKKMLFCPCVKCINLSRLTVEEIRDYLICKGILKTYTVWTQHGDPLPYVALETTSSSCPSSVESSACETHDCLDDLIRDIGKENYRKEVLDKIMDDVDTPLYPGCSTSRLSSTLSLFNLKAKNGWTDKSFTELLKLLREMLPANNTLSEWKYDTKKLLCPMGLEFKKIHACLKDYTLYRNEYTDCNSCPCCGESCYKCKNEDDSDELVESTKIPTKVVWYMPLYQG